MKLKILIIILSFILLSSTPVEALPDHFDWKDNTGNWMTPVKQQSPCGSCWAFAAVGAVEAQYNIVLNDPNYDLDLSEEYLVSDCCINCGSCKGGASWTALNYIKESGISDEQCFPYVDNVDCTYNELGTCKDDTCTYHTNNACSDATCSDRCSNWNERLFKIDEITSVEKNREAIKKYLVENGPLTVSLYMSNDFDSKNRMRCDPQGPQSGHAVILVGYDETDDYWIIKNSWGGRWGPEGNGYFKVAFGECGVESYVHGVSLTTIKGFKVYNDGDSDLYVTSITCPSWTTINPTSFTVSPYSSKTVTAVVNDGSLNPGTYNSNIYIYSNDPGENPLVIPITLIKSGNNPPEISPKIPNITTNENVPTFLDLTPYENDVEDSDTDLVWSVSDVNTALFTANIDPITDILTIIPVINASGYDDIILTLTDSSGETDSQIIRVTIISTPDYNPPIINLISPRGTLTDPYVIFKYNVSDKSEIAYCSLSLNGLINQTDTTITKNTPQYFSGILSDGNYNWSVICTDNSINKNVGISKTINFDVTISSASILLVDDDEDHDYESYYQNALSSNNYTYHNWDANVLGSPNLSSMYKYSIIIWFTSQSYANWGMQGTLNENETNNLKNYLSNGGNLFLSSQDYLFDSYGSSAKVTSPGDFAHDYLHISGMNQDIKTQNITGVIGDDITGGIGTINLVFPFADYSDVLIPSLNVSTVFISHDGNTSALKVYNGTYKVVFFAFPFEAIEFASDRSLVMNRTVQWFLLNKTVDSDGDGDPDATDCNKTNPNVHHGAIEICNNIDDNCNGQIDENLYRQCGTTNVGVCKYGMETCSAGVWSNCNSTEPSQEICDNLDNDCDGVTDENLTRVCGSGNCLGNQSCYGGSWNNCSTYQNDCGTCCICNPSGAEVYDSSQTKDCIDTLCPPSFCGAGSCGSNIFGTYPEKIQNSCFDIGICTSNSCSVTCESDVDNDTYSINCGDCNDTDTTAHLGATEICDGKDNDCDSTIDEGCPTTTTTSTSTTTTPTTTTSTTTTTLPTTTTSSTSTTTSTTTTIPTTSTTSTSTTTTSSTTSSTSSTTTSTTETTTTSTTETTTTTIPTTTTSSSTTSTSTTTTTLPTTTTTLICIPNWVLNDTWSSCQPGNIQFKKYYDSNNCSESETQPESLSQKCYYVSPKYISNNTMNTTENETFVIDLKNETNATLEILTIHNVTDSSINVTLYSENPGSSNYALTALGKYVEIDASPELENVSSWIIIKIYYTDEEISTTGLDEATLRIEYYNVTNDTWTTYNPPFGNAPSGDVNATGNYARANTTHFSIWGLFGSTLTTTTTTAIVTTGGGNPTGDGVLPPLTTTTTTTITTQPIVTTTSTSTTTLPTTTTTVPAASRPSPLTGFATLVSTPLGIGAIVSIIVVIAIVIFVFKIKPRIKTTKIF
jgi:hypothetical protein